LKFSWVHIFLGHSVRLSYNFRCKVHAMQPFIARGVMQLASKLLHL